MNRTRKSLTAAAVLAVGLAVTAGSCGAREVDLNVTGAQPVPGFGTLHRACDGPTLIYFTKISGDSSDDYEWFYPGGCVPADLDGDPTTPNPPNAPKQWVFNDSPPAWTLPTGDSQDGE